VSRDVPDTNCSGAAVGPHPSPHPGRFVAPAGFLGTVLHLGLRGWTSLGERP
jgi:hypothetical protein